MIDLKKLWFDKDIVRAIRKSKIDSNFLHNQLLVGKITLEEYLAATSNVKEHTESDAKSFVPNY